MTDYQTTRRCHNCDRHSWHVADGNPCPWCGKRTGKYHHYIDTAIGVCAVLAIIAVVTYVVGRAA